MRMTLAGSPSRNVTASSLWNETAGCAWCSTVTHARPLTCQRTSWSRPSLTARSWPKGCGRQPAKRCRTSPTTPFRWAPALSKVRCTVLCRPEVHPPRPRSSLFATVK